MKKIVCIIGNLLLYFISVLLVSYIMDKIWGIARPVVENAVILTIGWGIYQAIKFAIRQFKKTSEE